MQMLAKNRTVNSEDAKVVVAVTERSGCDLTKLFDDINIDWLVVERQFVLWSDLFHAGKKLRVNISINCIETGQASTT